jgi:hypothetical protein
MKAIEIEVMSRHYTGPLMVEPVYEDYSLFSVYLKNELIGRLQPIKKQDLIIWYSHELTDKELIDQIGEWIGYHFPLTERSFKTIYQFKFWPF